MRHSIMQLPARLCALMLLAALTACDGKDPIGPVSLEDTNFASELGIDLSAMTVTSTGLYIQDELVGEGEPAEYGDVLTVEYTGWLHDGRLFDSSEIEGRSPLIIDGIDGNPTAGNAGWNDLIAGWREGMIGMRPGGKRLLVVPHHLAYGASGADSIPPYANLVFRIELLTVLKGAAQPICANPGAVHGSDITVPALWRAADGPHIVVDSVQITSELRIDAGAVVCGVPGAGLILGSGGTLDVRGTAAEPVTLTARDPALPWGGISVLSDDQRTYWECSSYLALCTLNPRAQVSIHHALIERADVGVWAELDTDAVIESSRFRQIGASAVFAGPGVNVAISNSVIDTAGDTLAAAYAWSHRHGPRASLRIENSVIRGARGTGAHAGPWATITLAGVRIEGSGGVGLDAAVGYVPWYRGAINVEGPVRITGSGSYPARVPFQAAAALVSLQHPDSLLGNAADTLIVGRLEEGTAHGDPVTIPATLPWVLGTGGVNRQIRMQAGATLILANPIHGGFTLRAGIIAEGRADAPVTIKGHQSREFVSVSGAGSSHLSHVQLGNLRLISDEGHGLTVEDAEGSNTSFELNGSAATLRRVVLNGGGVRVLAGSASISHCEITGVSGDALTVANAGTASITQCNLVDNSGAGVNNMTAVPVDARNNWWGDAAGPHGPTGDGVSGLVDFVPFRSAPVSIRSDGIPQGSDAPRGPSFRAHLPPPPALPET